jgi:hypothetical protein
MTRFAILTLAALCALGTSAHARFILAFYQEGNNVVAIGSGTLDIQDLSGGDQANAGPFVDPSYFTMIAGGPNGLYYLQNGAIAGPTDFGTGGETMASAATGDKVGIGIGLFQSCVLTPDGYVSGSFLSDTTTWDNTTFAGLGITPGTYTWTWGTGKNADSFVIETVTPEPSGTALLAVALGTIGLYAWLRRRRGAAPLAA